MNEKPILVARQELIDYLTNAINSSNLPLFVIEPILQDILNAVRAAVQKQYEAEKTQYEQQLKEG